MMRVLVLIIALIAGGGAGGLGYLSTLRPEPQAATLIVETPTADVLAPRSDILRGGRLGEGMLVWTAWPEDRLRDGMILRRDDPGAADDLTGRRLRSNVYAGEPLRRAHLADGEGGYLALALQPRMRAVGVPVTASKTAGGFIMPNDRVDVLLTVIRDLDGDGAASGATRTILTNVRVLAIGAATLEEDTAVKAPPKKEDETPKNAKPPNIVGKTATLEVAPEQAEILLAASASGTLSLALRASEDFGLSGIGDVDMVEQTRPVENGAARPAPAQAAASPRREVTIISGGAARRVASQSGGPDDG